MSARLAKRQLLVEPDYWTCPHGVRQRPDPDLTYGPEVADLCAKAGFAPDPQQELGLDLIFAIRSDGSPVSFSFCIICARQNLKSGLFLQCCIGWMFVTEVPEIAWSAHELRTSLNAQEELFRILESPALSKYLPATQNGGKYDTNGKERQELTTGQTVWFQTRTRDGGRGLGKPKVIIDEAFKFKARTAGALLPILLAQHHPQLLRGSSAPSLDEDAKDLRDVIDRGRNHRSPEMSYLEWLANREDCADPDCKHPKDALARGLDCALDREHLLLQANPTVDRDAEGHALDTGRITIGTLRNLRQELLPEEYMRECFGWMDEDDGSSGPPAIGLRPWNTLADVTCPAPQKAAVVLYVAPDRSRASIGLVGPATGERVDADGTKHPREGQVLMMVDTKPGTAWVIPTLLKLQEHLEVVEVALHPSGQAGALISALNAAEIEFETLVHQDFARGCSAAQMAVVERRLVHLGQPELNGSMAVARTRMVNEAEVWDTRDPRLEISPTVAGATALHRWDLYDAQPKEPPPSPEALAPSPRRARETAAHLSW